MLSGVFFTFETKVVLVYSVEDISQLCPMVYYWKAPLETVNLIGKFLGLKVSKFWKNSIKSYSNRKKCLRS